MACVSDDCRLWPAPDISGPDTSPPIFCLLQVQKKISDEDKRLVQTSMLVGIAPELIGNTAEEMMAISKGRDHFIVQGVLRSGDSFFCCKLTEIPLQGCFAPSTAAGDIRRSHGVGHLA